MAFPDSASLTKLQSKWHLGCRHLKIDRAKGFTSKKTHSYGCWLETLVLHWLMAGGLSSPKHGLLLMTCQLTSPRVRNSRERSHSAFHNLVSEVPHHHCCFLLIKKHISKSRSHSKECLPLEEYQIT